jgi:diguanylate cyclase (GGDEF)-like protein
LDIDHFKSVNDQHGHLIGDALLTATSHTLAAGLRDGDIVARYGGEEFVVLLPGICLDQALQRAEDLRRRCASVQVTTPSGPVFRTVSAGVASVHGVRRTTAGMVTPAALLEAADQAMYIAKRAGRDRAIAAA